MPRDDRYPTPLLNMSPAGWPGLGIIVVMSLGLWTLFGGYFLIGLAVAGVVALVSALLMRDWRASHRRDPNLLHLNTDSEDGKKPDV